MPNLEYLRFLAAEGATHTHPRGPEGTRRLLEHLPVRDGQRVLELGCGTGGTLVEVLARGRVQVCGVDILPEMLAVARRRLAATGCRRRAGLVRACVSLLPFRDGSFDHAYTESVLGIQSAGGSAAMLAEVARVLRPGGAFVANEGIWKDGVTDRVASEVNAECVRLFGLPLSSERAWHLDDWLALMRGAGFEVVAVAPLAACEDDAPPGRRARPGVGRLLSSGVTAAYRLRALASPAAGRRRREYGRRLAHVLELGAHVDGRLFVLRRAG